MECFGDLDLLLRTFNIFEHSHVIFILVLRLCFFTMKVIGKYYGAFLKYRKGHTNKNNCFDYPGKTVSNVMACVILLFFCFLFQRKENKYVPICFVCLLFFILFETDFMYSRLTLSFLPLSSLHWNYRHATSCLTGTLHT